MDEQALRIHTLVAEGKTLRQIADTLGMNRAEACRAMARARIPIPERGRGTVNRTHVVNVLELFRLWNDPDISTGEIARRVNIRPASLLRVARRYGLKPRQKSLMLGDSVGLEAESDEDLASCESLRLAPTVAAAAAEVRRSWSDEERYQRRVTKVQPVTYDPERWR